MCPTSLRLDVESMKVEGASSISTTSSTVEAKTDVQIENLEKLIESLKEETHSLSDRVAKLAGAPIPRLSCSLRGSCF